MKPKTPRLSLTAVPLLAAFHGGCAAGSDIDLHEGERPTTFDEGILDGTAATAYPEAVVIDMERDGNTVARCSGAVIAPRAVLTAGHCVVGFDSFRVIAPYAGGQTSRSGRAVTYDYVSLSEHVDPAHHDVGLIVLDNPITLAAYPMLANSPLSAGEQVLNIGRMRNGDASTTELFVSNPIAVQPAADRGFPLDYVATERIEPGDSGGPDVLPGPAPHRIVAVNSGAGAGLELLARVDLVSDWIREQVARLASKTCVATHDICREGARLDNACDPCTAAVCSQDPFCCEQRWDDRCVNAAQVTCAAHCNGGAPDDGCGGVTYEGECQGDVVVFCDGRLRAIDCALHGLTCAWDPALGVSGCL